MNSYNRRNFIKASVAGGIGATLIRPFDTFASIGAVQNYSSEVALTTGDNRADMAFRALKPFSKQIAQAIGKKRVVLKPNNVSIDIPLCATHVDTLEGVLEFMKSIGKLNQCIIAESAAGGSTMDGFSNYGYMKLLNKYPVKLVDLDSEKIEIIHVIDERDFKPHAVRVSGMLLDPDSYIVSVARMKTHDRVLATLSLKNIVLGAPVKDIGFSWSPSKKPGTVNDKPIVHGGGFRGLNYNLYALARQLHPHLAVIDGFEGMEGNGPNRGTPVDHRVCVASTDWFAADRVGIELMGIDFAKVGYLNYCAQAGFGTADINKIKITGEPLSNHIKPYRLSDNIEKQLVWMNAV
ncbi:MAG: hypothetical protein A2X05_13725 [Bacteroidetes bacterium GWE2_41_25]|nr:MAG: hypothetical protein A2X03_13050 [Bacteroidetes bacterium GWA2_40_15]OFY00930.1 MAG: hypothetical protein A2X06_05110 [Bacteroidetes bacterium GWC2_40_22]OFY01434.1 MAG: hypothetical protein A2X05_13725 [Bacteroidetes bacterium GWE2_41_25]OFY57172.1 MAG: hypothetical protein A2X04_04680 [Bacteroidetes bacterium GWF2_41_9]HAM11148.1 hypothetical protein [Bacteroidales bacterium]